MRDLWLQFASLVSLMLALIAFRRYVEWREAMRRDVERLRREAQEREWRVGIPYDPRREVTLVLTRS